MQSLQQKEGVRQPGTTSGPVDPEVVQAIHRLTHAVDDFDKMGVSRRSVSRYELKYDCHTCLSSHSSIIMLFSLVSHFNYVMNYSKVPRYFVRFY